MSKPVDRFAAILTQTNTHRARHGCGAYPYDDGSLLGVIAAAVKAKRILELGCALGYTANWMAFGAPEAIVDTVDMDPEHVRLAQEMPSGSGTARVSASIPDASTMCLRRSSQATTWRSSTAPARRWSISMRFIA
jgi:predicted O-methyltransferase YrrM